MLINTHKFLNCLLQVIPRRTITPYTQLSTHSHTHSGVWITSSPLLGAQILADTSRGRCGCCHFMRTRAAPYNPQCTHCTCWKSTPEWWIGTPWVAAPHAIRLSAGCRLKSKLLKALLKLSQQHRSYFDYFLFSMNNAWIIAADWCLGYQVMDASSAAYRSYLVWFFLNSLFCILHSSPCKMWELQGQRQQPIWIAAKRERGFNP